MTIKSTNMIKSASNWLLGGAHLTQIMRCEVLMGLFQIQTIDSQSFLLSEAVFYHFCRPARNPVCLEAPTSSYCIDSRTNPSYSTPPNNCSPLLCSANQISSPNCKCAFPYTGNLTCRALAISNFKNTTYYLKIQRTLLTTFAAVNLPVDSISLSDPLSTSDGYFQLTLTMFPSQSDRFNRTGVSNIALVLTNQIYKAPEFFNPYFFMGENYLYYGGNSIFLYEKKMI